MPRAQTDMSLRQRLTTTGGALIAVAFIGAAPAYGQAQSDTAAKAAPATDSAAAKPKSQAGVGQIQIQMGGGGGLQGGMMKLGNGGQIQFQMGVSPAAASAQPAVAPKVNTADSTADTTKAAAADSSKTSSH